LTLLGAADAVIALPYDAVTTRDTAWALRGYILAAREAAYRFDSLTSKKEPAPTGVKKIAFAVPSTGVDAAKAAIAQATAVANGIDLTKDLGNNPANVCTPTYLANTAKKIAKDFKLEVEILDRKQLQALKMGSFLSVTNGSVEPPKFIVLKHAGGKSKDAPIVLVGKGITFDSGGISLKPGAAMDEMKYDMGGAASVLGTMRAIAEMKLKLNVIVVIPTCENMPSGSATKPGDIVTSMSGQTIEVLNTDAEGRLVLCDALTYVERFKPAAVIDVATLTGACITALGHHNSGLFTRSDDAHDALANELLAAGKTAGDTAWRMPIEDSYQEQLKSNFADMANIGGPAGGAVTAACFLERYTKKYTWAHLDIAGTAWRSGAAKGSTGRPVPLLTTFLIQRAQAAK
jgi:leucyl aminopeptidase